MQSAASNFRTLMKFRKGNTRSRSSQQSIKEVKLSPYNKMSFCGWSSGEHYRDHFEKGIYVCSACNNELFHSKAKFEHSSPWPSFTELIRPDSVSRRPESRRAIKISCGNCGNGLGHEFIGDGPKKGQSRF